MAKQSGERSAVQLNRRRFGAGAASLLAAIGMAPASHGVISSGSGAGPDAWRRAARRIGQRYLESNTSESDVRRLLGALGCLAAGPGTAPASLTPQALAQAFAEDYRIGRTVEVDGWILSRTETALCALEALG